MIAKKASIFAGLSLSEQTPTAEPPVEQRLFIPTPKSPTPPDETSANPPARAAAPVGHMNQSALSQEVGREGGMEGKREPSHVGGRERGTEDFLLRNATGVTLYDLNTKPNRKDSFLFTDEEFFELKHIKLELQEHYQFDVGKDDIARCAFRILFRDYRNNGERSELIQSLRNKRGK